VTWNPYPELDDEQLRALGGLTWEAIRLEGMVDRICNILLPGSTDRGPVSSHVKKVEKAHPAGQATPQQEKAISWLNRALSELNRRNAVLHSVAEIRYIVVGDDLCPQPIQLRNTQGANTTHSEISALAFKRHADAIHDAFVDWREIEISLTDRDANPWPPLTRAICSVQ
jgi:hypothetical protein